VDEVSIPGMINQTYEKTLSCLPASIYARYWDRQIILKKMGYIIRKITV